MQSAELTVLGTSPAWENPGGACSGYLLRSDGTGLLLESGPGVIGRLRRHLPLTELSAVIISHMHADHFLDLVPLCYGVRYGDLRPGAPLPVFLPPDGARHLSQVASALNGEADFFSNVFDLREYSPGQTVKVGGFSVRFEPVRHYIPGYAMRFNGPGDLVFSGDSAPCEELVELSRGAGTLLCEAAIPDASHDNPDPHQRGHMSAAEAGEIARQAAVHRLMITHYRLDTTQRREIAGQARRQFSGVVSVAREGRSYRV